MIIISLLHLSNINHINMTFSYMFIKLIVKIRIIIDLSGQNQIFYFSGDLEWRPQATCRPYINSSCSGSGGTIMGSSDQLLNSNSVLNSYHIIVSVFREKRLLINPK